MPLIVQSNKKVNNFSDSVAEGYLNYGCYKVFINSNMYSGFKN